MRRPNTGFSVASSIAVGIVLNSCTAATGEQTTATDNATTMVAASRQADLGSPLATYDADPAGAFNAALIEGTIIEEGGCVYLMTGADRILPVFPVPSTRWDPANRQIRLGDVSIGIGDKVGFGGSGMEQAFKSPAGAQGSTPCDHSRSWFVAPNGATIIERAR